MFRVATFKTNGRGQMAMQKWLNNHQEKDIVENIWTTVLGEDQDYLDNAGEQKLRRVPRVQVIVKLKRP